MQKFEFICILLRICICFNSHSFKETFNISMLLKDTSRLINLAHLLVALIAIH